MISHTRVFTEFIILIATAVVMTGCAPVSYYDPPIKNALTRVIAQPTIAEAANVYKLKTAQVVWIDNHLIKYDISKVETVRIGEKAVITPLDNENTNKALNQLLFSFRESLVKKIKGQFEQRGVIDGNDVIVEITPTNATYIIGLPPNGRNIVIRTTIKEKISSKELWSIDIVSYAPATDKDHVVLDNYISALFVELRSAGWIS
jgi:hypothetical protein